MSNDQLILDGSGRSHVSLPDASGGREWWWAASNGQLVAQEDTLKPLGTGRYQSERTGHQGTEAELLAKIGTDSGWHFPVRPV